MDLGQSGLNWRRPGSKGAGPAERLAVLTANCVGFLLNCTPDPLGADTLFSLGGDAWVLVLYRVGQGPALTIGWRFGSRKPGLRVLHRLGDGVLAKLLSVWTRFMFVFLSYTGFY